MILTLLSFTGFLKSVFYIIIALLILLLMITIHELGHYTFGKLLGFKINEFAIGFGKTLYKKQNKKTGEIFSIRLLPLGGFCAFAGEDEESDEEGAFNKQKPWKRLIVLFGGVFFNFLSAIIFSTILLMVVGNPLSYQRITAMDTNSINYGINKLQVGDIVTHIDGTEISYWDFTTSFSNQISQFGAGETFTLTVKRENGAIAKFDVTKYMVDANGEVTTDTESAVAAVLGIKGYEPVKYTNIFSAFGNGVLFTIALCWMVLVTIGMLFTGKLGIKDVGGPVTTIQTMATVTSYGWQNVLYLIPLIATNLAVFNILPFPALDGARMVFTGIEWVRGKPINRNVEGMIHTVGLIILFAFVIIVDVLHFIL